MCVCVYKYPSIAHCISQRKAIYDDVREIKLGGKRGKHKTLLEGSKFYLGRAGGLRAGGVFVFQMLMENGLRPGYY